MLIFLFGELCLWLCPSDGLSQLKNPGKLQENLDLALWGGTEQTHERSSDVDHGGVETEASPPDCERFNSELISVKVAFRLLLLSVTWSCRRNHARAVPPRLHFSAVQYQHAAFVHPGCARPDLGGTLASWWSWCRRFHAVPALLLQVVASQRSDWDPDLPALLQPVPLCVAVQPGAAFSVVLGLYLLSTWGKEAQRLMEVWATGEQISALLFGFFFVCLF